jgi:hypothetical protein
MPSYGISLLSGGLDSTTVTALAKGKTDHLTALTFHYGQSHSKEVDCAAAVARSIGVEQELMDISFLGKVAWYSALTNPERFPVPEDQDAATMGNSIPITYVPLRNTFFCPWLRTIWRAKPSMPLRWKEWPRQTCKHTSIWPPTPSTTAVIPTAGPSSLRKWASHWATAANSGLSTTFRCRLRFHS